MTIEQTIAYHVNAARISVAISQAVNSITDKDN